MWVILATSVYTPSSPPGLPGCMEVHPPREDFRRAFGERCDVLLDPLGRPPCGFFLAGLILEDADRHELVVLVENSIVGYEIRQAADERDKALLAALRNLVRRTRLDLVASYGCVHG